MTSCQFSVANGQMQVARCQRRAGHPGNRHAADALCHFRASAEINVAQEKLLLDHPVLNDVIFITDGIAAVVLTDEGI